MKTRAEWGVTLPELLVAMAILGIVMVLEAPVFVASQQYFAAGSAQTDAQSAAHTAPLPVVQEIQETNITGILKGGVNSRDNGGLFSRVFL